MVRNYKKKGTRSGEVDEVAITSAVKDVIEGRLSFRKSAEKYNIKVSTLQSRVTKSKNAKSLVDNSRTFQSKHASHQVFSVEEENLLNKYIIDSSKLHYGLTLIQVRRLAYDYAKINNLIYPSSWDENKMAGIEWIRGFRKRHSNISLRKPENTSAARSFGFNRTAVNEFYTNLETLYSRHKFTPDRIYNFDESGITTVLSTPKVLAEKTQKQVGQLVSAERGELVTFGGIISATGNTIPPLFVFPRVHYKDHFVEGAPEGSLGFSNKSGWINSDIFLEVLKHIQKHTLCSKNNPILLLCDNHESHITINAVNYAREFGIVYLSFPPHTSHRLQPLDVGVFGPFKSKLKTAFNDWHVSNPGKTLTIYNIPKLAKLAYLESFSAKNIISGFSKPGIWPFNKLAFSDDDFAPVQIYQPTTSNTNNPEIDPEVENIARLTESPSVICASTSATISHPESDDNIQLSAVESSSIICAPCLTTPKTSPRKNFVKSPAMTIPSDIVPETPPCKKAFNIITPELVRPFPKIIKKENTNKGRQKGKSRIYTDTPEKNRLEDIQREKEMKRNEQERKRKAKEMKRNLTSTKTSTKKQRKGQKTRETRRVEPDSSDSDRTVSLRESSCSSLDLLDDETEVKKVVPENIKDESFVLVRFEKKNSIVHYVALVKEHYTTILYRVLYLRKKPSTYTFVFPNVEDEASVFINDVVLVLPDPVSSKTARTSTMYHFPIDLTRYNFE